MGRAPESQVRNRLRAGGRRIRTLGPSRREVLERSNISTRWILFQGGLRVRIRLPPPTSQERTAECPSSPLPDAGGRSPGSGSWSRIETLRVFSIFGHSLERVGI